MHWRTREYYPAGTTVHVDAKLYGVAFGDGALRRSRLHAGLRASAAVRWSRPRRRQPPHPGDHRRRRDHSTSRAATARPTCRATSPAAASTSSPRSTRTSTCPTRRPATATSTSGGRCGSPTTASSSTPTRPVPARRATPTSPTAASTCRPTTPQQYFDTAIYGDPVEVTGTSIELSYADGDIWDWAVDWDDLGVDVGAHRRERGPGADVIPSTAPATPTDAPTLSGTPTPTTTSSHGPGDSLLRPPVEPPRRGAWSRGRITI